MDHPKVTPKDFFLWAGAVIALFTSVVSLVTLLFSYINHAFPDALTYYVDPYSGPMRASMAALVVAFPIFLLLMRLIRNDIERDVSRRDIWIRRWALVFTVFVAGVALAIDLVVVINNFLGGELTTAFALKALSIFLIAGAGLLHFIADMRGFWATHRTQERMVGYGVGVLLICVIAGGFLIMGSPSTMRAYRFDEQKVNNLQEISWQVTSYWQRTQTVPASLSDLNDSISGYVAPVDPQNNQPFEYKKTGNLSFQLCATFNKETRVLPGQTQPQTQAANWQHGVGRTCFDRTIDPTQYPPYDSAKTIKARAVLQ